MSQARPAETETDRLVAHTDDLVASGRATEAIDLLAEANRRHAEPVVERRLVQARYRAFAELDRTPGFDRWPVAGAVPTGDGGPQVPVVEPESLSGAVVRDQMMAHGAVHVPGLLDERQVEACVQGIDAVFAARNEGMQAEFRPTATWYRSLDLPREQAMSLGRDWVFGAGGALACDSPRMSFRVLEIFAAVGLREVVADYLGERPVLSGNKWTLRRVPTTAHTDWHQDGAFLGDGIRALNVWVALTDCGVDAPGMDLVPKRFETVQETGTGGAIFDWAVGPDTVATLAADAPVVRPRFAAGDALLFDDLYLHRTAIDEAMTRPRYAIESWFFAASSYPDGQVPIVW